MTTSRHAPDTALAQVLRDYGAGLRAELALLHQMDGLSKQLRQASEEGHLPDVTALAAQREHVAAALMNLEEQLRPLRSRLADHAASLTADPAFREVSALHREAGALVATIMSADADTVRVLRDADDVRRSTTQALEAGEATLAAYRRSVSPAPRPAGLVDQRG